MRFPSGEGAALLAVAELRAPGGASCRRPGRTAEPGPEGREPAGTPSRPAAEPAPCTLSRGRAPQVCTRLRSVSWRLFPAQQGGGCSFQLGPGDRPQAKHLLAQAPAPGGAGLPCPLQPHLSCGAAGTVRARALREGLRCTGHAPRAAPAPSPDLADSSGTQDDNAGRGDIRKQGSEHARAPRQEVCSELRPRGPWPAAGSWVTFPTS